MARRHIFLPIGEPHRAIIDRNLVLLNADRALYREVETGLGKLVRKGTVAGKAWNDMHESSKGCAAYDTDLKAQLEKMRRMQEEISVGIERHESGLAELLKPIEGSGMPDQPPIALIKAAWKIVSQELGGMDKIRAQGPAFFDGLFNEENARLRRELESLKVLGAGSQLVQCDGDRGLLLAQKDSALLEIGRLRKQLNAKDATIKSLEIDVINNNKLLDAGRQLGEYQDGRIKGFKEGNESNLVKIRVLEEEITCLNGQIIHAKEDIKRLEQVAVVNAPKLEDHAQEYAEFRVMAASLEALEVALDTMVHRSQTNLRYVRSTEGRLELLNGLGKAWRASIKHFAKAGMVEQELRDQNTRLEERIGALEAELKLEKSKVKAALQRSRVLGDEVHRSRLHTQFIGQRRDESNRRIIGQKSLCIRDLELQNSKLKCDMRSLNLYADNLAVNFTNQTILLAETSKSRCAKMRIIDKFTEFSRKRRVQLEEVENKYKNHISQTMDYVLLCISWEDLEDSAKLSTFNDLTSKLLPVAGTERQLMGDSPKWAWFIANPYELHANGAVRYVGDGCRAFPLAVKLYMLVEAGKHCSHFGFNIMDELHCKLMADEDSFGPTVFMITVDLYVSKLRTMESLQGEEVVFAITLYKLWYRIDREWPDIWRQVCLTAGVYDPMIMMREIQKLDGFLQRIFDILTGIEARDSPQGMSFVGLMKDHFPESHLGYEGFVMITQKDSEYLIMVDTGPHHAVVIIRKSRFSFVYRRSGGEGLIFELEGFHKGVAEKRVFRNEDSRQADEWWRDFIGPFMDMSLSPEEMTRSLELLSLYESGKIKY